MIRRPLKFLGFAAVLCLIPPTAFAQQRVHAASGIVTAIHPKIQMIQLTMDDGSAGHFKWLQKSDPPVEFDKAVSADAAPAEKYTALQSHVIVYYVGESDNRIAVAVHPLGDGPLNTTTGTIVKLNRKDHQLTIKTTAGTDESFRLDPKTVGDTSEGVLTAFKYDFNKGNSVRVTFASADSGETALLITPAM
jgi:hypothetical protein